MIGLITDDSIPGTPDTFYNSTEEEEKWDPIFTRYPLRHPQISFLKNLIAWDLRYTQTTLPCIFVHGPPATGKSSIIKASFAGTHHAFVNCLEHKSLVGLLGAVMAGFAGDVKKRVNMGEFLWNMRKICGGEERRIGEEVGNETRYVILDNAEHLRDVSPPTTLAALMKLKEATWCNITVILISHLHWNRFEQTAIGIIPYFLTFPQQSYKDLRDILIHSRPSEDEKSYSEFVDRVLPIFHPITCDLNELRRIHEVLFVKYLELMQQRGVTGQNTTILYQPLQFFIKEAIDRLFTPSFSQILDMTIENNHVFLKSSGEGAIISEGQTLEFPTLPSYLLIAAFLASFNPQRLDLTLFTKENGRKKRSKVESRTNKIRQQLLGPKPFPLERLLAIFRSIITEEGMDPDRLSQVEIQAQIGTLESSQLLRRMTAPDRLEGVKYKCLVSFERILQISKRRQFDISKYLFDFA
ncbi:origin recognition complex subunit 5 C-terminus-domain-containing protein [Chytridium lagenaria]|nr:origin recognition complex subunit 5 C-terminus-domain-containing protein [Chytridium lagenaria]